MCFEIRNTLFNRNYFEIVSATRHFRLNSIFSSKRQHYDFGNFLFYFNSAFACFFMNNKIYYDTIFLLFLCVLGKVFFLCVSCTLFFLDSRSFHYITFPAFVNASLNRMMILTVLGGKFMTLKLTLDKYFVVVKLIT